MGVSVKNEAGEDMADYTVTITDSQGKEVKPEDMKAGEEYTVTIEYPGDDIISSSGCFVRNCRISSNSI